MGSTSRRRSDRSARSRVTVWTPVHDGEVAHPAQQAAGDARRAAGAAGDLVGALLAHADAEHPGAAAHDQLELLDGVELEPDRDAEAVAQGRGEQACAGGGADKGEFRQLDLHRAGRRALADDEVELVILHGRIEDFLDRRVEAVDLVDEEHVALFEIGELRRQIARLGDDRAGGRAEIDPELAGDDLRQRRLAETRRPDEEHMVEGVAPGLRRIDEDLEIGPRGLLAREIVERQRPERRFGIVLALFGSDQAAGIGQRGLPSRGFI